MNNYYGTFEALIQFLEIIYTQQEDQKDASFWHRKFCLFEIQKDPGNGSSKLLMISDKKVRHKQ